MEQASEVFSGLKVRAKHGVRRARLLASREEVSSMVERFTNGRRESEVVFADENARIAWQTTRDVERIAATMPPEGAKLNLRRVSFDDEHTLRGLRAVFAAGTVIGTGDDSLLVPERTVRILDRLRIPYQNGAKP